MDLQYGAFYCLICKDYQYNEIVEDLFSNFFIKNKILRFGELKKQNKIKLS